jgi:hypothetical protein
MLHINGERRGACKVLVRKPEGTRLFGRPSCRWEYAVKMDLEETGYEAMDWIDLVQVREIGGHL